MIDTSIYKDCLNPYCQTKDQYDGQYKIYCSMCGYSISAAKFTNDLLNGIVDSNGDCYPKGSIEFLKWKDKHLKQDKKWTEEAKKGCKSNNIH